MKKSETQFVNFKCSSGKPGDALVCLEDGKTLGHIQSFHYQIRAGEAARAEITTILTPAELKVLQKDTTLKFVFDRDYFWQNLSKLFLIWFYKVIRK